MAAYQYGAIDPSVSSSATEKERIEARRSFGLSKASYLSQMDSYYAGLTNQKEMQQAGFEQEEKMFDKGAPFEWEKLRIQEKGIDVGAETQRYGVDVGAETQRYGVDVGAETSRYGADKSAETYRYGFDAQSRSNEGELGYQYDWMATQEEQFEFGNRLAAAEGGFSYEDLSGGSEDLYDDYTYNIDASGNDIGSGWNADY